MGDVAGELEDARSDIISNVYRAEFAPTNHNPEEISASPDPRYGFSPVDRTSTSERHQRSAHSARKDAIQNGSHLEYLDWRNSHHDSATSENKIESLDQFLRNKTEAFLKKVPAGADVNGSAPNLSSGTFEGDQSGGLDALGDLRHLSSTPIGGTAHRDSPENLSRSEIEHHSRNDASNEDEKYDNENASRGTPDEKISKKENNSVDLPIRDDKERSDVSDPTLSEGSVEETEHDISIELSEQKEYSDSFSVSSVSASGN